MAIDHTVSPMASKADSPEKPASARSPAYRNYLRSLRLKTMFVRGWQLAVLAAFLVLWEIAPRAGWVNPLLTSYPSAVFQTLRDLSADGSLYMHTWATVRSTFVGFVAGSAIGLVVAIALWLSPTLYRILDPFVVVVNALPKIALVPIFYIWLGDVMSIYAMAISVSVFVTVLMLYTGFQAIEPEKLKLVKLYGASKLQMLRLIVLPGCVPMLISTLKVSVGLTLIGVIVGEFQSAKAGLGYLITYGGQIFQMNLVMAAIVVLALISTVLFGAIQALEQIVARRKGC
jgi:NitT/TauT family transport system permease protein